VHAFSRRAGIAVNNYFAVSKVGILLVIIILGFVHAGRKWLQSSGINELPPVGFNPLLHPENITSVMINNAHCQ
jgi:hypothetical protein